MELTHTCHSVSFVFSIYVIILSISNDGFVFLFPVLSLYFSFSYCVCYDSYHMSNRMRIAACLPVFKENTSTLYARLSYCYHQIKVPSAFKLMKGVLMMNENEILLAAFSASVELVICVSPVLLMQQVVLIDF